MSSGCIDLSGLFDKISYCYFLFFHKEEETISVRLSERESFVKSLSLQIRRTSRKRKKYFCELKWILCNHINKNVQKITEARKVL